MENVREAGEGSCRDQVASDEEYHNNVVSAETLHDAQANPEKHRDLIVRVAGYSGYFCGLTKALQDEIIARTEHTCFSNDPVFLLLLRTVAPLRVEKPGHKGIAQGIAQHIVPMYQVLSRYVVASFGHGWRGIRLGVYLDNAATSFPKPDAVLDAMEDFMRNVGASSGRGAYRKALEADKIVFRARQALARLLGVRDVSRIVFTANATESLNLAIKGLLSEGDHVVTTSMEHNAVWRPLKSVERTRGVSISQALCAPDGTLDPGDVEALLRPNTKLIVMTHASNVIGTIMPVEEVGAIARVRGIPLLVDCAQTAGVYPIDVERLNIDLAVFTGHKGLMGPTGTGGLYIRSGIDLVPLKEGGTGGESVLEHQPDALPDRFEAGTLNVVGIAGLGAGARFVLGASVERIMEKEARLVRRLLDGLLEIPGIEVYGPKDPARQVGVVSLNVRDIPPEEVAHRLDVDFDIMVRAGLHCAPCAHRTIGTIERGTVRIGLGYFNTEDDIDRCVEALTQISASTL